MNIAVIPARGGSKRIPRKNIKEFAGKPMIAWSIEAALASQLFDHTIVSTDDQEIAAVAKSWGAEVPFMRPKELADDYVGTGAVTEHALDWALEHIGEIDCVCTIYATAPFIQTGDIKKAYDLLVSSDAGIVFTATSFPFPIQRAIKLNEDGRAEMFYPEHLMTRSQDLEKAYHDAGQFYWAKTDAVLNKYSAFSNASIPFLIPRYRVQDIDDMEDWEKAEIITKIIY